MSSLPEEPIFLMSPPKSKPKSKLKSNSKSSGPFLIGVCGASASGY
jgi:hypothetical protein